MLPSIHDFRTEAFDPSRYARLGEDWWVAAADVEGSTKLAKQGRDREVNFVAGAAVAAMAAAIGSHPDPAACQFGGDGAVAVVPPERVDEVRRALAALGWWAAHDMEVPLRVGMVPVAELNAAGHQVLAALHDFGNCNAFGQFLGSGVPSAESWMKADQRWRVPLQEGEVPGLEGLSCRWEPIPPRRGHVLCVIIDPVDDDLAAVAQVLARLESIVPTEQAAPLGDGEDLTPVVVPRRRLLGIEVRTGTLGKRLNRLLRAVVGSFILGMVHRLGGRVGGLDVDFYRRKVAERSDYRKLAGGPRLVLDVTAGEDARIEALLSEAEAQGLIHFGLARSDATTMTCMVGDFSADRHVHFVDGQGLGFWRASVMLKNKLKPAP
ncbi:DUF3095 family protein [Magnetospirillum sp. 64-120]|uniref:DUF3095 family protein n=1 Tax=Magnetospirillum sp. 64-120 TaxID=1895778 RepID=UPI000927E6D9|nr:DUF3095 family protein [Magnetospirillum sp. 64-120]OJX79538.1 MAG: hypothetical protein BGO92_13810 [Magnetospirillum sp. 64-120]